MRRAALLLAALLLLSACGAGESPPETTAPPAEATTPVTTALPTTTRAPLNSAMPSRTPAPEPPTAPPGGLAELAEVYPWFENYDSRDIDVVGQAEIDGVFCTVVQAAGEAGGQRYILATIALHPEGYPNYHAERADNWMDAPDDAWERFQNDPWFAVADSPDGQYRMEAIGMWMDGPSGFHVMDRIRLISLIDGAELWTSEGAMMRNSFRWSPGSRFVSVTHWGRIWAETFVVDTAHMSVTEVPRAADLCALEPELLPMKADRGDPYVVARDWESDTGLILDIRWTAEDSRQVDVECRVDVLTGAVEVVEFSAQQVG